MIYSNVSIWKGEISHTGDAFYLDGKVEPEEIKITCYTPRGSFEPKLEVIKVEEHGRIFNPLVLFFLSILVIFLAVPVCVGIIIFSKY